MAAIIKLLIVSLCFTLAASYASCQIVKAESSLTNSHNFITNSVQLFKSKSQVSLTSIIKEHSYQFQKISNKEIVFSGYDEDYYWFRFVVANTSEIEEKLILVLGPLGMRDSELFQGKFGSYKSIGKTGVKYPFVDRPYPYAHFSYPLTLPPATLDTFYLSMDFGHEFRSYSFVLLDQKVLKNFENNFYLTYGIIVGLLLLFLILNLYLFFWLKEKIHIWYSFYICFLILIVLVNDELIEQIPGFDSEAAYKLTTISALGGIAIAILIHVVQLFLTNIKSDHIVFKITSLIKYNLLISALAHLIAFNFQPGIFIEEKVFYWVNYSTIIGIIAIIVNCFYSYYWGFRAALPIFLGLSLFFIGSLQKLFLWSTPSYLFPPSLFHIGIILETTTISFVLFYRHRHERNENQAFSRDREKRKIAHENEILENKLNVQEVTFKNISQEIHDNIGQLLTFVKVNLNDVTLDQDNFYSRVTESESQLQEAIQDLQDLSRNTQKKTFGSAEFINAIKREIELIRETTTYEIQFDTTGESIKIDDEKAGTLYRIFQEVVNNIIKHADATKISINIDFTESTFSLQILDNGKGFSVDEIKNNVRAYGLGLRNIESRAKAIGADLKLLSNPQHGTVMTLTLNILENDGKVKQVI